MSSRFNRMVPSINALTHACSDVSQPALMILAKDGKRYIIGRISEGFQRSLGETKIKSSRLQGIWLTGRLCWSNVSGLPGYLLTLADASTVLNRVFSASPENIQKMTSTWKYINWHDKLTIQDTNSSTFSDENLEIQPFLVLESTCYIIQMQPTRGKFLAKKAIELGVPQGKLFGQLSNGSSVVLDDGTVVHSHQVLEPGPIPTRAVVLDLPTNEHLERAVETNFTKRKRDSDEDMGFSLDVVYHFLGEQVDPESETMAQLIAKFPSYCLHYISHPHYSGDEPCFKSLDILQQRLKAILPSVFPTMRSSKPEKVLDIPRVKILHQGDVYSLNPKMDRHDEVYDGPEVTPVSLCATMKEPMITTLGTGASCPSKYRNVSATVVRVPTSTGTRALLFDCGEGTTNSLRRLHTRNDFTKLLRELDILYISHMHADHHLGTLELLKAWQTANPRRTINVVGPEALERYLQAWALIDAEPLDLSRINFIDLENIIYGVGYGRRSLAKNHVLERLGLKDARACKARHCDRSYSGALTYELVDGQEFKVAYSGDTRPSPYFSLMAKGANVLIHEATHDDELAQEAKAKKHSTVSEAAQVATQMEAKNLVLTHFSQRYPKMHASYSAQFSSPTCFGFDGMQFKVSQVGEIQAAMPEISAVFNEIEEHESDEN